MNLPLIVTKLGIPPARAGLTARPHLLQRLEDGLRQGRRLSLLSAAAGFGKTTLVSEWLQPRPDSPARQVAWLSLDPADDQPARFCRYLLAALQQAVPTSVQGLAQALESPHPPPPELVMAHLINEQAVRAASGQATPTIIVLDDYHCIQDPSIHAALALLLERQPVNLHLVLLTRMDPPLPLLRLRARGLLTELRTGDLRFTLQEAVSFLDQSMHLDLTPEMIVAVERRTEGWIAGLQLAALSLHGHADAEHFIEAFSGSQHYIMEYLTEEVLERQPAEVQDFLLRTALLERLNAGLCAAVLQDGGLSAPAAGTTAAESAHREAECAALLENLARANLFIAPLDAGHTWFRYHGLFAEILRQRLGQRYSPEQVRRLHQRAGEWYAQRKEWEEAMPHLLAAAAYPRIADIIEQHTLAIIVQVRLAAILSWLQAIPPEIVRGRPWLCLVLCWVLVYMGRLRLVRPWLKVAEDVLAAAGTAEGMPAPDLPGHAALLRAFLARRSGDLPAAVSEAQTAARRLAPSTGAPPDPNHALAYYILGQAFRLAGDLPQAQQAFEAMVHAGMYPALPLTTTTISGLCELANLARLQGRLDQAEALYRQAASIAAPSEKSPGEHGWEPGERAWEPGGEADIGLMTLYDVGLAGLLYERDQLTQARLRLERVIDSVRLSEWWGAPAEYSLAFPYLAGTLLALDDLAAAAAVIAAGEQLGQSLDLDPEFHYLLQDVRVRLWLRRGETQPAEAWAAGQVDIAGGDPKLGVPKLGAPAFPSAAASAWVQACRGLTRARLALGLGQPKQALDILEPLAEAARQDGRLGSLIEIGVWQAAARYRANPAEPQPALAVLEECLRLSQPQGYRRTFLDAGPLVGELLARLAADPAWRAQQPGLAGYVDGLLTPTPSPGHPADQFPASHSGPIHQAAPAGVPAQSTGPTLLEPLTERERDVLLRLCAGQSNAEIAGELVISLNTVKKHVTHLFAKLGVTSRVQAILRASELGLLQDR